MADLIIFIMSIVDRLGYAGVFSASALEYACFPLSSELLLPFIGCCVYNGEMELIPAVLYATLGAVVGCSFCFYVGRIGKKFLERLCVKYPAVKGGIMSAEESFDKYGDFSVFMLRLFPIARTYISFPAGMSRMTYRRFVIYTSLGAFVWNSVLISSGYILGEYWSEVSDFMFRHKSAFNVIIAFIIILLLTKLIKGGTKNKRRL